jgi:hypothetical protein
MVFHWMYELAWQFLQVQRKYKQDFFAVVCLINKMYKRHRDFVVGLLQNHETAVSEGAIFL